MSVSTLITAVILYILNTITIFFFYCFMVFNPTLNNISVISWQSVLLVEETGEPLENHRPVASDKLYHNLLYTPP
jgi:hypothetical protein